LEKNTKGACACSSSRESSFVKVIHGTKEFVTGAVVHAPGVDALNPIYDVAFRVPLASIDDANNPIVLQLMNAVDKILAETTVEYTYSI